MKPERLLGPTVVGPALLVLAAGASWWLADRALPNPDEGAYLTAAAKILDGAVYYRDIDAYPFPGSSYLLALAMSVAGEHLSVARALAGASFCAVVLATWSAALALTTRARAALCGLSLLALKFWAFPNFSAYLYSDLAIAFAMAALALFVRRDPDRERPLRWIVLGVLTSLALFSKQNTGIYVGGAIVALVVWQALPKGPPWRSLAFLAGGAAIVAVPVGLYFASQGLLGQMLYSGLVRPFTGYLPTSGVSMTPALAWWDLGELRGGPGLPYLPLLLTEMTGRELLPGSPEAWWIADELFARVVYTTLLGVLVACGVSWLRGRRDPAFVGAVGIGVAIVASAFPRADYPHLINVYPVVLLLLFSLGGGQGVRIHLPATVLGLLATVLLTLRYDAFLAHRLSLERADLWVRESDAWLAPVVHRVQRDLAPDEPLFVYGHEAYYYFLTDRYFPWPFSQLYPGMAGGDDGRRLAGLLRELRPKLVLRGVGGWPGTPRLSSYTSEIKALLSADYRDDTESVGSEDELPPGWVFRLLRLDSP